jgi:hypothetical protein
MTTFAISGRCLDLPPDWRERLAVMLGAKPRRIGNWAELGLYGALTCLAEAGEQALPPGALLLLGSRRGTYVPTGQVLEQMRDDLPMPLTFLQTQPSQLLAMLAAQMRWRGQALFIAGGSPEALLRLAAAQSGSAGLLLGWVDEDTASSHWLRLLPAKNRGGLQPLSEGQLFSRVINCVHVSAAGLEIG